MNTLVIASVCRPACMSRYSHFICRIITSRFDLRGQRRFVTPCRCFISNFHPRWILTLKPDNRPRSSAFTLAALCLLLNKLNLSFRTFAFVILSKVRDIEFEAPVVVYFSFC